MTPPLDTARLKTLAEQATHRPWKEDGPDIQANEYTYGIDGPGDLCGSLSTGVMASGEYQGPQPMSDCQAARDCAYIVAACNAVPDLLAALDQAERRAEAAETTASDAKWQNERLVERVSRAERERDEAKEALELSNEFGRDQNIRAAEALILKHAAQKSADAAEAALATLREAHETLKAEQASWRRVAEQLEAQRNEQKREVDGLQAAAKRLEKDTSREVKLLADQLKVQSEQIAAFVAWVRDGTNDNGASILPAHRPIVIAKLRELGLPAAPTPDTK